MGKDRLFASHVASQYGPDRLRKYRIPRLRADERRHVEMESINRDEYHAAMTHVMRREERLGYAEDTNIPLDNGHVGSSGHKTICTSARIRYLAVLTNAIGVPTGHESIH